jgi:hypothetical protein
MDHVSYKNGILGAALEVVKAAAGRVAGGAFDLDTNTPVSSTVAVVDEVDQTPLDEGSEATPVSRSFPRKSVRSESGRRFLPNPCWLRPDP